MVFISNVQDQPAGTLVDYVKVSCTKACALLPVTICQVKEVLDPVIGITWPADVQQTASDRRY